MRNPSASWCSPRSVALACAVALAGTGCRDDVRWQESGGDVNGAAYRVLDYEVTSARYRKWIAAQRALDGVELGEPVRVDLRNLTESDIDRVEASLAGHAAARAAIESAGLTVRDFVLTTVALAQPWAEDDRRASQDVDLVESGNAVRTSGEPIQATPHARPRVRVRDESDSDSDSDSEKKKKRKRH